MSLDTLDPKALPEVVSGHRLVSIVSDVRSERRFAGFGPQGRPIELRAFRGPRASDADLVADLERTLSQASLFRHRAILAICAWGRSDGSLWVAGDPSDGVTVADLIQFGGELPARAAVEVALEVAGALDYAFTVSRQVPGPPLHHGALTLHSVEVTAAGRVRVRDLGLGPLHEPPSDLDAAWVPPEVRAGEAHDILGDLFSLGVLLARAVGVEILGASDWAAQRVSGRLEQALDGRGPGLGGVVMRLTEVDPRRRFESAAHAQAALLSLRSALPAGQRLAEVVVAVVGRLPDVTRPLVRSPPPGADPDELTTAGGSAPAVPPGPPDLGSAPTVEEARPLAARHSAVPPPAPRDNPVAGPPRYSRRDFVSAEPPPPVSVATRAPPSAAPRPIPTLPTPVAPITQRPRRPPNPPSRKEATRPTKASPKAKATARPQIRAVVLIFAAVLVAGALVSVALLAPPNAAPPEPVAESPGVSSDPFKLPEGPEGDEPDYAAAESGGAADDDPTPLKSSPPAQELAMQPTPAPRRAEKRTAPARRAADSVPVTLSMRHRPVASGGPGASELVSVRMDDAAGANVVLHFGPPGGPFEQRPLGAKSGGRWEGWLPLPTVGGALEYWVTAEHPRASLPASSGSRSAPHRVSIQ